MSFSLITGTSLLMLAIYGTTLATTIEPSPANEKGWSLSFDTEIETIGGSIAKSAGAFYGKPDVVLDGSTTHTKEIVSIPLAENLWNIIDDGPLVEIKDDVNRGLAGEFSPPEIKAVPSKMDVTKTPGRVLDDSPTFIKEVVSPSADQVEAYGPLGLLFIKNGVQEVAEEPLPFAMEVIAKTDATKTPDRVLDGSPASNKAVVSTPVAEQAKTMDGWQIDLLYGLLLYTLGITLLFFFILYRIMRYRMITRDPIEPTKKQSPAEIFASSKVTIIENEKMKECV